MPWQISNRGDPWCCGVADRHYSRQKIGSPQFVPPGRCVVLKDEAQRALWVTSWPFAEYVKHAWAGAWVNTMFRNEGERLSSDLILSAIAHTLSVWEAPPLGLVTFVCPKRVRPIKVRGASVFGFCYQKAGFRHVGFTKGGLWAWQLLPAEMPAAIEVESVQARLFA